MRNPLLLVGCVLIGSAVGIGSTAVQLGKFDPDQQDLLAANVRVSQLELADKDGPLPKVVVEQVEYNFGSMEFGTSMSHDFAFRNDGEGPLELAIGGTTCQCTLGKVTDGKIPPGESVNVTLSWTAKEYSDHFRQSARVYTNDPARTQVELTVVGRITQQAEISPQDLVFSDMRAGQSQTAQLNIWLYTDFEPEVLEHRFEDPAASEQFEVRVQPMTSEQIEDRAAQGGLNVLVTAKDGLPIGSFNEVLHLTTNIPQREELAIPIRGQVTSDVFIYGGGWDGTRDLLNIGVVKQSEGARRELTIRVGGGEDPSELGFEVESVSPEAMRVSFGEPQAVSGSDAVKVPLIVEVPPGTHPVSHLSSGQGGYGEIVLRSNLDRASRMRLQVRFAVEH
ncbi:MAG: DUF1573 domain-containing protein [Pirellulales bacterium]